MTEAGLTPAQIAQSGADWAGGASGVGTSATPFSQSTQALVDKGMNASNFDKLLKGTSNTTFNADFFKKNLMPLGAIAAPLLMGGGSGGNLFGGNQQAPSTAPGYIRPYTYQQTRNPGYTGAGTPYFTQIMTPGTPVAASDFGATTMADGGITSLPAANPAPGVVVYDPVSGRYIQQSADTVPMTPIAAPVTPPDGGMMPMQYDPMARQYVTPPPAVAPMAAVAPPPNDYYYGNDGEGGANESGPSGDEGGGDADGGGGDGGADGSGEGWNSGGLMSYAMGGDIGGRYASPDDGGVLDKSSMVGAHQTVNMAPHYPMQGRYQGYAEGGGITNTKMAAVQQYSALAASSADGMKQVMAKAKAGDYNAMTALNNLNQTPNQNYAQGGGIYNLGSYSDGGRLLKGPGDGVSDDIPAQIGARQPARLADGEFVVPARVVSELGNGSTDAGAKRLYAMMDRVQKNRRKSVGKGKVAVDSKAYKHLPA